MQWLWPQVKIAPNVLSSENVKKNQIYNNKLIFINIFVETKSITSSK